MNKGVRTTRFFKKGDIVAEYAGDLLVSKAEFEAREAKYIAANIEGGHQFKFHLNGKTYWLVQILFSAYTECTFYFKFCINWPVHLCICCKIVFVVFHRKDGTDERYNPGRCINHSAKTYVNLKPLAIELDFQPVLVFMASKDIPKDEELFYDYNDRREIVKHIFPWMTRDHYINGQY